MLEDYLVLCLAALLGGAINSVAGGGTLTFPALFAALGSSGEAAVAANATSTVALVWGSMSAVFGYRAEIVRVRQWCRLLIAPSVLGGIVGTLLVVWLPGDSFKMAVPWLILTAALLFAIQPKVAQLMGLQAPGMQQTGMQAELKTPHGRGMILGVIVFQFFVAVYGGYFGAGIGILMLAALAMMGIADIHEMNAVKTLLAAVINGVSAAIFIGSGNVHWPFALAMGASSIVGGYAGARLAKRLNRTLVRNTVVAIGFGLAGYYFYRLWLTS